MRRLVLLMLAVLCIAAWAAAIVLLRAQTTSGEVVIPTLMVLPSLTPSPTSTPSLTPSTTPTITQTPTLTPTPETPTATLATRVIEITAYMPGVYVPPSLTPIPPGVRIIPAPPNPFEPLPDATLSAPPFAGWFSFESDHPLVSYFPAWERRLADGASRGQYHRTEAPNARTQFPFEGEGLRLRYVAAPNMGVFEVFVDSVRVAVIDGYAEMLTYPGTDVYFVGSGSHTLELRPNGEKNPRSEGFTVGLDAVQVYRADAHTLILPPAPPVTPSPTPRDAARIELLSAPPLPAPTNTPIPPQNISASLVIAYDENGNGTVDPAEGVQGISVRLVNATTNQVIGSGFTDARGYVKLETVTLSPIRLVVPYFGESWDVRAPYNVLFSLAGIGWGIQRGFIMMGYSIELLNQWLVENAFSPLIAQTNASLQIAVSLAFVVALLVLGITYLLAVFARMRVVDPKSAIAWYLAAALFFTLGPELYRGMSDFRRTISQGLYASTLSGLQSVTGATFSSLGSVQGVDLPLLPLCDNLGTYMPGATVTTIDGLDVALSYLRADGIDVMGYFPPWRAVGCQPHPPNDPLTGLWTADVLPWEWKRPGSYFDNTMRGYFFSFLTPEQRQHSLAMATSAQARILTAWPLVLFGVAEQLVYLLLTIAQGITFLSFGIAVMFAFFKKTEAIARSIIDLWIELIIQTIVIALIQALVAAFFLIGAASGNSMVVLGIGLLCLIFMVIVLWSGVRAVWNAFNRLFSAFGQATGGAVITPGTAALMTTAGAVGAAAVGTAVAGGAVSVGSNALAGITALNSGATKAQAAGVTFGGNDTLTGAARAIVRIPALDNTPLGDAAEQFLEGAVTRRAARELPGIGRVAGPLMGAALLSDRDPDHAERDEKGRIVARPMLIPAVGEHLKSWVTPGGDDTSLRTGVFTEIAAADSRGEEIEEKIGQSGGKNDAVTQAASRLQSSAEALERIGTLRVSGSADVSSVLGDAIRLLGDKGGSGVDYLTAGNLMARAMGVDPQQGTPPIGQDLARFGLFLDQAAKAGLSPALTERIAREVKSSGEVSANTRTRVISELGQSPGFTPSEAERRLERIEIAARMLPEAITAYGKVSIPEDDA